MEDLEALTRREPIPPVDPKDLRSVWELMHEAHADNQGSVGFDGKLLMAVCQPGANIFMVWARCSLLEVLMHMGMLSPGQLDDAVFAAAATFPIAGLDRFDPEEFLRALR